MKAFFATVRVNDAGNLIDAWASIEGNEFANVDFALRGEPNDTEIMARAKAYKPDVVFYIGAAGGEGLPSVETLRALRRLAPSVNLCWDAADRPWHPLLEAYRKVEAFDLIVGLDGYHDAPVDLVTVTPVNPARFERPDVERTIRCGFTGNIPSRAYMDILRADPKLDDYEQRSAVLHPLGDLVEIRIRDLTGPYSDYVDFLKSCQLAMNTSMTGSGERHHVKARVVEIPLAGAALLEMADAPTHHWLPKNSFFTYRDIDEAAHLIRTLDPRSIAQRAAKATAYVRSRYGPEQIFGAILARLNLR